MKIISKIIATILKITEENKMESEIKDKVMFEYYIKNNKRIKAFLNFPIRYIIKEVQYN